ncbi:hypothetical protein BO71DRAFT_441327 [Aspergillus ellipticus CBS 707.79]|uniref:RHS repeat protein n=1 Tax=Aspergillus ellipticus CBS 707.79 TaxID=1448320 RepID=A0A319ESN3_9EURO|nr:hypothetical protein BO71DRAFT_441327 [Aspergillus ellipticus CBS 707.79]
MIYSQGFNFNTYLEKGVDPRTGQYNCAVDLYEVPASVRNCPPLKLTLHYNPLSSEDVGLGRGWSFNHLSSYDHRTSRTLLVSTGENYRATETSSSVFTTDQKLKTFVFQKTGSHSYRVTLKSGQVEILSNLNNVYNTSVPTEVYGANGRSMKLSYVRWGEQPRLSKIQADSQDLVMIDYADAQTTVTRAPGTAEAATFTLVKRNNQLVELRLPLEGSPSWKFTYGTAGLTNVTSPTGASEDIAYRDAGFLLPSGAPVRSIPYVISHTVRPFHDQPAIRTTYSYSDHNFLGYGGGLNWRDGEDNLYRMPADYEYSSTAQVVGGTTTRHTYNKFHLLVSTQQQMGTKQTTQTTTYYALSNTAFDHQPPQYQAPTSRQTTYRDTLTGASRTETTHSTFDDWGNETSETPPSGIRTTREYYPPAGETASGTVLCPADPHGFQRYLELETVTPAASPHATPTRAHRYTYLTLPTAADAVTDYCVAAQQRQTIEGSQTLSTTAYTYVSQPQSSDHGRIQQQTTRLLDQDPTTYRWTYNHPTSGQLREVTSMTGFDGQTTQEETTSSLLSGLSLATKDRAGIETAQQYDAMGRVLRTTTAPGTAFEATKSHSYAILNDAAGWRVTVTDTKGVQTRYFTDGLDRVVRVESQDDDGSWDQYQAYTGTFRVVQERRYNDLDQCSEQTEIDWLRASGRPTEQRTTHLPAYDDWGQVFKVTKNSGAVQLSATDPIALTQTVGNEGDGLTRITYNAAKAPISEALIRRNGTVASTIEYAYDGLGRRVQMTDGLGRPTQYRYDSFDRVVQTTWPDSHAITTQYAPHSTAALPAAINLQGATGFSEQSFDGLDRPVRSTVGGRTTTNVYEGVAPVPSQVTFPNGGRSQRTYEPALNYAMTGRDTDAYQYDKQTGDVVQLDRSRTTVNLGYYPSSLLSEETADGARSTQYVYSQAGKLQQYTDVHGQKHEILYDAYGRRQEISVGPLKTTLTYDQADRVTSSMVQDTSQSVALTTNIGYDEFGREIQRTVLRGSTTLFRTTQTYDATGQVIARDRADSNNAMTRQETFQYDTLSRLVDYQCQGTQPPVDEQGRSLRHQHFTFNGYDGLTRIETSFADGTANTQTNTYSTQDPTQLVRITNTHPDEPPIIHLEYDANGCLTRDEHGRTLVYNASRLLSAVYSPQNELLSEYHYDATDRLARQTVPNEPDTQFSYRGDTLIAITKGDRQTSFGSDGGEYWGEIHSQQGSTSPQTQLYTSDSLHSITTRLDTQDPSQPHDQSYTPYGTSPSTPNSPIIAFTGQWRDPITGWYHLGQGHRVYSPNLQLFLQPDTWSPFTSGEINPYAYCLGDPINRADPSGHWSWRGFAQFIVGLAVGIAITVATGGLGFAAGLAAGVAVGVAVNVSVGAVYDLATGTTPTLKSIAVDAVTGAIGGLIGGAVGGIVPSPGSGFLNVAKQGILLGVALEVALPDTSDFFENLFTRSAEPDIAMVDTPGHSPDAPLEKVRQGGNTARVQGTAQKTRPASPPQTGARDDPTAWAISARNTSRETVTAEELRANSWGGGLDEKVTIWLGAEHRVAFTIDPQLYIRSA